MLALKSQIIWCGRLQKGLLICIALMGVAFWLCVYGPQTRRERQLAQQIGQTRGQADANESRVMQLPALEADISQLRADLADVRKLTANPEMGQFMSQIKQASQDANLREFEVSFPGAVRRGEQPVSLRFEGDFYSVFAFLSQAEQMKQLTRVTNISIHGMDLKSGQVRVNVAMNLYFSER